MEIVFSMQSVTSERENTQISNIGVSFITFSFLFPSLYLLPICPETSSNVGIYPTNILGLFFHLHRWHLRFEISSFVDNNNFPAYVKKKKKMSRSRTWGDQLEILALANALQRNIEVIYSSRNQGGDNIVVESGNARLEPFLLGYIADKHWVSLEPSIELTALEGTSINCLEEFSLCLMPMWRCLMPM